MLPITSPAAAAPAPKPFKPYYKQGAAFLEGPPCGTVSTGRPIGELLLTYQLFLKTPCSDYKVVNNNVCVSKLDLSLPEFCQVCKMHCLQHHHDECQKCAKMIAAADMVLQEGIFPLSAVFKKLQDDSIRKKEEVWIRKNDGKSC